MAQAAVDGGPQGSSPSCVHGAVQRRPSALQHCELLVFQAPLVALLAVSLLAVSLLAVSLLAVSLLVVSLLAVSLLAVSLLAIALLAVCLLAVSLLGGVALLRVGLLGGIGRLAHVLLLRHAGSACRVAAAAVVAHLGSFLRGQATRVERFRSQGISNGHSAVQIM